MGRWASSLRGDSLQREGAFCSGQPSPSCLQTSLAPPCWVGPEVLSGPQAKSCLVE